ncbi:D-amino-acid transaminase [Rhizobium sp. S95]|uniref:Probable branched-chain-amino-acid aminotransferase n=1 Tax=Ciceribacter sichuanensis TaxID=2949647 RepID=A0AAJ1C1S1_9HYPH|nr:MULTISPECIES: D-amino-acid transaminase [unclassified Ciceribacter]MCM2397822.1 D-amino-acid transaminase [Ciceribacter sp. S95]MCM2404379.1 D-amino-acid transaminase [Ciceribacter sp. S153]MCO5960204.1 D-amino-acid transaminase [Ciceribacter sp. S101]
MSRIVYCAGQFVQEDQAHVSLFDRGFLFGDGVYEVTAVIGGRLIDNDLHLARFKRSLGELAIPMPASLEQIELLQQDLITKNGLTEGTVYLQATRGQADRDFLYPDGMQTTLVGFTQAKQLLGTKAQEEGIAVALAPDPRWARRDIKTVMLLGQVMAKRDARAAGFGDVWLTQEDHITEGASSTAYIVTGDNRILTRGNSRMILPGCTRQALLRLCDRHGLTFEERSFTQAEAESAVEAFQTSASSLVTPVIRIGDVVIGDGKPGPLTRLLQSYYLEAAGVTKATSH